LADDAYYVVPPKINRCSRRQYDTTKIISRYDKAMAMSTLSQFLFLGTENTGSYALASWQGDLFALAIRSFQNGIAAVINRHAITKLVRLNDNAFAGRTGYPKLVPGTVGIPDLKTFSEFINTMVGAAVLTPDDELERHVRQTARLPQATISVSTEERIGRNNQNSMNNNDESANESGKKEDKPEE